MSGTGFYIFPFSDLLFMMFESVIYILYLLDLSVSESGNLNHFIIFALYILYILKNFLFIYEKERKRTGEGGEGEGQADSSLGAEPDARLDLRTLRS